MRGCVFGSKKGFALRVFATFLSRERPSSAAASRFSTTAVLLAGPDPPEDGDRPCRFGYTESIGRHLSWQKSTGAGCGCHVSRRQVQQSADRILPASEPPGRLHSFEAPDSLWHGSCKRVCQRCRLQPPERENLMGLSLLAVSCGGLDVPREN